MRVYYLDYSRILKKSLVLLAFLLALVLMYKMIQYNILAPATGCYEPIYQGSAGAKKIALTVNVVWGEEFIPQMLDILKKNDVLVTFNIGGQWAEKFPELTKEMAQAGHEIGNHGYNHPHPTYLNKKANSEQILKTEKIIQALTGHKTNLFAPPYGEFNEQVLQAAGENGYKTILWSIDTIDWQKPAPAEIIRRVTTKAHNGAIVLMHPTAPTVKALPSLLAELKKEGYQFVKVSDIIQGS
jgi:probable sporulation protein (polysaccharide deacetylase family)